MKRNKNICAIIELIILTVVVLLEFTVLNIEYLFKWAAHNWEFYMILGLIAFLLLFLNKQIVSIFMTVGIVIGIFLGNYLGKFIKGLNESKIIEGMKVEDVYRLQHNPGFEIWIGIILTFLAFGIVIQITISKKHMKR